MVFGFPLTDTLVADEDEKVVIKVVVVPLTLSAWSSTWSSTYDLIWYAKAGLTPGVSTVKVVVELPLVPPVHVSKSVPVISTAAPLVYAKFPIIAATLAAATASEGAAREPTTKTTFGVPLLNHGNADTPASSTLTAPTAAAPNIAAPAAAAAIFFTLILFTYPPLSFDTSFLALFFPILSYEGYSPASTR